MRFRLSTLLTAVALASLSIGWATDHVRQDRKLLALQQETESKLEMVNRGTRSWCMAYGVIDHAHNAQKFPERQDEVWRHRLILTIMQVWKNREVIRYAELGECTTAQSFCHAAMKLLEFDSPEAFFQAASDMFFDVDVDNLPVIKDQSSKEHKAFARFIADSRNEVDWKNW
jgi:hypothetical protein